MKTKSISLVLALLACNPCFAQLRIEDCYQKAQANYPLIKQYDLIEKTKEYNLSNVNKGYLPQVMFSAKATYQSDVTQIPIDFSQMGIQGVDIPTLSKDQYGATVDVNQTIWDGGAIKSQKEGLRTAAEVEKKNVEVSIYSINERVNQLYFGVLLTDEQIRQNQLLQDELKRNYDQVQSYVQNGIANQADLDAIKVDQLKAEQNKTQFVNTKKAYTEMLSKLIGEEVTANTEFVKPDAIRPATHTINRPELELFNAQIKNLETKNREINAGLMPKLGLFATGGYGKPGLNMLSNDFDAYYIAGAKISWNIGNFYTRKNSKRKVQTSIRSVETQRETFLFNTNLDIVQKDNNINSYFDQLKYDDEIIALRGSVKRASEAKMANGTLSGSDLTRDINAEQMAMQDKILHEMELLLAIYNLKFATNN
ncbi:MAG: TolC family protein [Tannerella sp.]|jgi:outer membrane protein TolC|nr:TolC family protein [Tannerella sp.]